MQRNTKMCKTKIVKVPPTQIVFDECFTRFDDFYP